MRPARETSKDLRMIQPTNIEDRTDMELAFLSIQLCHTPRVRVLENVTQDPGWHPEGNAFEHTIQASLLAAKRAPKLYPYCFWYQEVFVAACTLHDIGKASTSCYRGDGRIISPGHAGVGADMVGEVLWTVNRLDLLKPVERLVRYHMHPRLKLSNARLGRLYRELWPVSMEMLYQLSDVDTNARKPIASCNRDPVAILSQSIPSVQ